MDEITESVLFLYKVSKYLKKRKKKRQYTKVLNTPRYLTGEFYLKHPELRESPEKFLNYYQMSKETFDEILCKLKQDIRRKDTNLRMAITPEMMLSLTLRYFITGNTFQDIGNSYCIGLSTVRFLVHRVACAIWGIMKMECIPDLSRNKWLDVAGEFESRANFPHCIGAVDQKQVRIAKTPGDKELYSTVLLAVVDTNYNFVHVDVGTVNQKSDCGVFQKSTFCSEVCANIPESTDDATPLPYVMVANEGFPEADSILMPYSHNKKSDKEKVFNCRIDAAKKYSEGAFALMSNRWKVFNKTIKIKPDFLEDIVKACCVLHNFIGMRDGHWFEDGMEVVGWEDVGTGRAPRGRDDSAQPRDTFADYFVTERGAVPWQRTAI